MLALRSGGTTCTIERLVDHMISYGLVRFGKLTFFLNENHLAVYLIR